MKVSLFITCLADQFYPQVGVSTVRLLRRFGCDVVFPESQTCCGQPAFNSGYRDDARRAAINHVRAFAGADYVVSPSGSCTSMVTHYYKELFQDDPAMLAEATELINKSYELSQFLVNVLHVSEFSASFPHSITYHPSCHGSRLLGVRTEPMTLLEQIPDMEIKPLNHAQDCCGFGGAFAVKMGGISTAMVGEKCQNVQDASAEYLVSSDLGCLMNMGGALRKNQVPVKTIHLAELLDKAIAAGESQ